MSRDASKVVARLGTACSTEIEETANFDVRPSLSVSRTAVQNANGTEKETGVLNVTKSGISNATASVNESKTAYVGVKETSNDAGGTATVIETVNVSGYVDRTVCLAWRAYEWLETCAT